MLIGHKNTFAIEVELTSSRLAKTRLWINNIQLGAFEDEIILGSLLGDLNQLISDNSNRYNLNQDLKEKKKIELFTFLLSSTSEEADKSIFGGAGFDDFDIRVVFDNDKPLFMWKLIDSPFFKYKNLEHHKLYYGYASIEDIKKAYETLLKKINLS